GQRQIGLPSSREREEGSIPSAISCRICRRDRATDNCTTSLSASVGGADRVLALRPPGLPDWPFLKRVCSGGLPQGYPVIAPAVRHAPPFVGPRNDLDG